jgi:hypothetical protein
VGIPLAVRATLLRSLLTACSRSDPRPPPSTVAGTARRAADGTVEPSSIVQMDGARVAAAAERLYAASASGSTDQVHAINRTGDGGPDRGGTGSGGIRAVVPQAQTA